MIYYVALPFVRVDGGLAPGDAVECPHAAALPSPKRSSGFRPGDVFFGVAEAAQGPSGAALANAIRDATGQRLRDLPFTAARIKEAIGV
jgi:CO/xanthine dehydrogenase Mo-binding subunit